MTDRPKLLLLIGRADAVRYWLRERGWWHRRRIWVHVRGPANFVGRSRNGACWLRVGPSQPGVPPGYGEHDRIERELRRIGIPEATAIDLLGMVSSC